MPSLDFSSGTTFNGLFQYSSSFANVPANIFDNTGTITGDWANAFKNCALTVQSIGETSLCLLMLMVYLITC